MSGKCSVIKNFYTLQPRPVDIPAPHAIPDWVKQRLISLHLAVNMQQFITKPGGDYRAFIIWLAINANRIRGYAHEITVIKIKKTSQRWRERQSPYTEASKL